MIVRERPTRVPDTHSEPAGSVASRKYSTGTVSWGRRRSPGVLGPMDPTRGVISDPNKT
jgi:hypothetical protein